MRAIARAAALVALILGLAACASAAEAFQRELDGDCLPAGAQVPPGTSLFPERITGDETVEDNFYTQVRGAWARSTDRRRRPCRQNPTAGPLTAALAAWLPCPSARSQAACTSPAARWQSLDGCSSLQPPPPRHVSVGPARRFCPATPPCPGSSPPLQVNSARGFSVKYYPTYKVTRLGGLLGMAAGRRSPAAAAAAGPQPPPLIWRVCLLT